MADIRSVVSEFVARLSAAIEEHSLDRARAHVTSALGGSIGRPGRPPTSISLVGRKPRKTPPMQLCPVPGLQESRGAGVRHGVLRAQECAQSEDQEVPGGTATGEGKALGEGQATEAGERKATITSADEETNRTARPKTRSAREAGRDQAQAEDRAPGLGRLSHEFRRGRRGLNYFESRSARSNRSRRPASNEPRSTGLARSSPRSLHRQ